MMAGGVPVRDLHMVWSDLWPLLAPAVKRSPDKPNVLAQLLAKDAQLWAVYEGGKPVAAIVTKVQDGEERRCLLWLVGGSRVKEWATQFIGILEAWARENGCVALWGCGRKGWHRVAPLFGGERIDDFDGQPAWERKIA